MAIQAQLYPENLGLPLMGGGGGLGGGGVVSQDWLFMANNQNNNNIISNVNNNNNSNLYVNGCGMNEFTSNNNNLQQQKQQQQFQFQQQQQQQEVLLQLQQQYLLQFQTQQQQQQQRSSCENNNNNNNNHNNNDGFVFLSTSKNRATTTTTATTASTTTTGSDYQPLPMNFSPTFADQLEKQRQEIDRFITLQNERLKLALQEQRKQQLASMMRKLEAKAMQLLRQKDDEIARAGKRTMELEEIIRKMEVENQEWQRLAAENEAMVVSLSNTIEQIKEQQQGGCCITSSSTSSNEVGDAESCCNFNNNNNNDESYSSKKRGREEMNQIVTEVEDKKRVKTEVLCKVCKTGNSCVLLLPCRHLCCCKDCEAFVDVCPVCKSAKMASIEALFS